MPENQYRCSFLVPFLLKGHCAQEHLLKPTYEELEERCAALEKELMRYRASFTSDEEWSQHLSMVYRKMQEEHATYSATTFHHLNRGRISSSGKFHYGAMSRVQYFKWNSNNNFYH